MLDENGYPTEETLKTIREWDHNDFDGLMAFVKKAWCWPEFISELPGGGYLLSTGGWSGNEEIYTAIMENKMVRFLFWYASMRGGHHEFRTIAARGGATSPRPFAGWKD